MRHGVEPSYRASEVLVASSGSPKAMLAIGPVFEGTTRDADFAATLARLGGSAHLIVKWDGRAAALRLTTTSPNRDDANRTLVIADTLIMQRLAEDQAGTRREDLVTLEPLTRPPT
jgi:hypothetical protein